MSLNLAQLHAQALAARESGWSGEARSAAEGAYRAYGVQIAEGLPFPYSLMRVEHSHMATGHRDLVHIMPAERINLGKLRRLAGQSLCRGDHGYADRLSELVPVEEGASCYLCLEVAEKHSKTVGTDAERRAS